MKTVLKIIGWLLFSACTCSCLTLTFTKREDFLDFIIKSFKLIRYRYQILELISPAKYFVLIILLLLASGMTVVIIYFSDHIYYLSTKFLLRLKVSINGFSRRNSAKELTSIILMPLLLSFLLAAIMPISYDEAWTYINFTKKGLIAALCYYPAPNNHVFYSLLTCFSKFIPFLGKTFCLRLPAILSSFFTLLISYDFTKRLCNQHVATLCVALMSTLFMNIYYSYMARGYSLVLLFFVISCYAAFQLLKKPSDKYLWVIFSISNLLGFWTMPSFLYPFLTIQLFFFLQRGTYSKFQIVFGFLTMILVAVLYTPIVVINGLGALINNSYVSPIDRNQVIKQLPDFTGQTLLEITGLNLWVMIALLSSSLGYILIKKRELAHFFLITLGAPVILLLIHSVIPFPRTFYYYSFIFCLLIALPLGYISKKINNVYIIGISILIQCILIFNFRCQIRVNESYSLQIQEAIDQLKINKQDQIYCNSALSDAFLLYNNLNITYINPHNCNLDSILPKSNHLYFLIDKQLDKSIESIPQYSCLHFNVYTNKQLQNPLQNKK